MVRSDDDRAAYLILIMLGVSGPWIVFAIIKMDHICKRCGRSVVMEKASGGQSTYIPGK